MEKELGGNAEASKFDFIFESKKSKKIKRIWCN